MDGIMKGKNHRKTNRSLAAIFSIFYLWITKSLALIPLIRFWLGAIHVFSFNSES
jgi:hypothetical protein